MSLLFFETMWIAVLITSFQLYNIEPEPQKLEIVFFKLNNTLEYFQCNHILFSLLKDFLKTIFDKVRFLVICQSGFQPVSLRITEIQQVCSIRTYITYIYIYIYIYICIYKLYAYINYIHI